MTIQPQTIFISYASPDRDRVTPYANRLEKSGFDVWIDHKRLKLGQNWEYEIGRALDRAAIILVFISENSVDRRGYVQREVKFALDKAKEKLVSDIYIIPVMLDEVPEIPEDLKKLHYVRAWETGSYGAIEEAIKYQLTKLGAEVQEAQERANLNWSESSYKEAWEGLPGYEVEYSILNFSSNKLPQVVDITTFLHGEILNLVMAERSIKFQQDPEHISFGQDKWRRLIPLTRVVRSQS